MPLQFGGGGSGGGMANPMTTADDIIKGGSGGSPTRLAKGSNGQVLTMVAGVIAWAAAAFSNPMTTLGDLIRGGASGAPERLPVGSNGDVLTVVSGEPEWAAPSTGFTNPMTTTGDIITGGASGAAQRLAVGSSGQVLSVVSGAPAWATPAAGGSSLGGGLHLISDETLASPAASYTTPTIPAIYDHLLVVWAARGSDGSVQALTLRANGDTGANYDTQTFSALGTGTNVFENHGGTSARVGSIAHTGSPSGQHTMGRLEVPFYASTVYQKNMMSRENRQDSTSNSETILEENALVWRSTAAITSLTFTPGAGNIAAGSRFQVFGIKAAFVGARVRRTTDQATTHNAATAISFDAERHDAYAMHDNGTNPTRITIPTGLGGFYHIGACVAFDPHATGFRQAYLLRNGTDVLVASGVPTAGSGEQTQLTISTDYELAAGDYLELIARQSSGTTLDVVSNANFTPEMWIHRIN